MILWLDEWLIVYLRDTTRLFKKAKEKQSKYKYIVARKNRGVVSTYRKKEFVSLWLLCSYIYPEAEDEICRYMRIYLENKTHKA